MVVMDLLKVQNNKTNVYYYLQLFYNNCMKYKQKYIKSFIKLNFPIKNYYCI